jgi:peptide-methionine (S)-S-oxide reductase
MKRKMIFGLGLPLIVLLAAGVATTRGPTAQAKGRSITNDSARRADTVVLAGGCYWGVESVYEHVRGISAVRSGFASPETSGDDVSAGPVEAVRIVYDPSALSYEQILAVFFTVAHDPTQLNRQGPDVGKRYRSMVFVANERQRFAVKSYIDSLNESGRFEAPIVTELASLRSFLPAEESQQNYAARHPRDRYILTYDAPRIDALRRHFPGLFTKRRGE